MRIETTADRQVTIVSDVGDLLTRASAGDFEATIQELIGRGQLNLLIDLQGVRLAGAGMGALARAYTAVGQRGQLKLLNVSARIAEMLKIYKFDSIFEQYGDKEKAVQSFHGQKKEPAVQSSCRQKDDRDAFAARLNPFMQKNAVSELGRRGNPEAIPGLLELFENTCHFQVREEILRTLDLLGHTTDSLRQRVAIFDPVELVRYCVERPPYASSKDVAAIHNVLPANFQREGAAASDRLADLLQSLVPSGLDRMIGGLDALSVVGQSVVLTPKLERVLTEIVSSPVKPEDVDHRTGMSLGVSLARSALAKLKGLVIVEIAIEKTLALIASNRKFLQGTHRPLYFPRLTSPDFDEASTVAQARSAHLYGTLRRAQEHLEQGRKTARDAGDESQARAMGAFDQAEQALRSALEEARDLLRASQRSLS